MENAEVIPPLTKQQAQILVAWFAVKDELPKNKSEEADLTDAAKFCYAAIRALIAIAEQ